MNNLSKSTPEDLPSKDMAFGLKQCLGNTGLLYSLLQSFWKDYHGLNKTLLKLNGLPEE